MIFFHFLTSSNYDDTEARITGGRNGYGAKLTGLFSTQFTVESIDSKNQKKFRMTASDNMSTMTKPKITTNKGKSYTKITFTPDYEKFKIKKNNNTWGLDEGTYDALEKRAYDTAACTDKRVAIYWNNKLLKTYNQLYILEIHV